MKGCGPDICFITINTVISNSLQRKNVATKRYKIVLFYKADLIGKVRRHGDAGTSPIHHLLRGDLRSWSTDVDTLAT